MQTTYWKNSEALWNHTLAVTTDNDRARYNLGYLYQQRGELDRAIAQFERASKIRSRNAADHYNAVRALIENNVGAGFTQKRLLPEAIPHYEIAVKLRPDYGDPYLNLGTVLFRQGRTGDAIEQWHRPPSLTRQASTLRWGARFFGADWREGQLRIRTRGTDLPPETPCLGTIWLGSSRPPPMLQFVMGIGE